MLMPRYSCKHTFDATIGLLTCLLVCLLASSRQQKWRQFKRRVALAGTAAVVLGVTYVADVQ